MSKKTARKAFLTKPPWADRALTVRVTDVPLPTTAPDTAEDVTHGDLVHRNGPDGWAVALWRASDPDSGLGHGSTEAMLITAPDGLRSAVLTEGSKRSADDSPCKTIFSMMVATATTTLAAPIPHNLWHLLPGLHNALLRHETWIAPQQSPAKAWDDARRMMAWAPYGYTPHEADAWTKARVADGRAAQRWQALGMDLPTVTGWTTHGFKTARDAAPYFNAGITKPADAHAWRTSPVDAPTAVTLHKLGWHHGDVTTVAAARRYLTHADSARLASLAELAHQHGLATNDAAVLHAAGITVAEAANLLNTGTFSLSAARTLVALRSA